jgi:hypothetical protein
MTAADKAMSPRFINRFNSVWPNTQPRRVPVTEIQP